MADPEASIVAEDLERSSIKPKAKGKSSSDRPSGILKSSNSILKNGLSAAAGAATSDSAEAAQNRASIEEEPAPAKPAGDDILSNPVVKDLRAIDDEYLQLEKAYHQELLTLERKYEQLYAPILAQRRTHLAEDRGTGVKASGTPALPDFWKTVFQNSEEFQEMVEEYDEPVLEYLQDVTSEWIDPDGQSGFKVSFFFAENPYFTNTVLSKTYHTEKRNEFIDSLECTRIEADKVAWKEGKNVTVDLVTKKAKKRNSKQGKPTSKKEEVARPSFFRNFFRPLGPDEEIPEDEKHDDHDDEEFDVMQMLLADDHEQGIALRDHIIPHAVRWYTGEACEDVDDEADDGAFDEDEEEEDDDDDDDEEAIDLDDDPGQKRQKDSKSSRASDEKEDCKQQ